MRSTLIGISFLLVLCSAAASAQPGGYRRDGMGAVRAYQMQGFAFERGGQRDERQVPSDDERRRRGREPGASDSSGYGAQDDGGAASDQTRKQGKLSPEERRALRRQIDEAGQDLYTRKR